MKALKWISGIVVVGVIVFWYITMGPGSARSNADHFLTEVTKGNYDKAFDYIYYFNNAFDEDITIPYDQAKDIWVHRVQQLKERGTYIKSFKDIDMRQDDGWPKGSVRLTVVINGEEKYYDYVNIAFSKSDEKWKVASLTEYSTSTDEEWEKAYSGYVVKGS